MDCEKDHCGENQNFLRGVGGLQRLGGKGGGGGGTGEGDAEILQKI